MKKIKEPAPHEKAAQIEKEAVRALSVDEVEEALTKSTYGAIEKDLPDDVCVKDIEEENERLRETVVQLRATIKELRNVRTGMAECNKDIEVLKTECLDLKEEKNRLLREIDDYKKTISKMKYAHEEEIRALEDDLAEAKILGKKANEYSRLLDDDSCAFERILNLADTLKCQAEAIRGVVSLIENETEARV